MKRLVPIIVLTGMLAVSGCASQKSHRTSSARAAYGDGVPDFKANRKKNQKRKNRARKESKQKNSRTHHSPFEGRPY
jgi:hypothetical protein